VEASPNGSQPLLDLFFNLLELVAFPSTWGRAGYFLRGACGIFVGVLALMIGTTETKIGGSLFLTIGIILILLGFARRESEIVSGKRLKPAPPDAWKPPDSAEVNKIIGGK
jgi:hypothetical protein